MTSEHLILIGTLGAALLGFAATLFTTLLAKRSEERKHLRELVVNAAVESWKQQYELAKITKRATEIPPLEVYIAHMLKVSEVLLERPVSAENIEGRLKEADDLTAAALRYKRGRFLDRE